MTTNQSGALRDAEPLTFEQQVQICIDAILDGDINQQKLARKLGMRADVKEFIRIFAYAEGVLGHRSDASFKMTRQKRDGKYLELSDLQREISETCDKFASMNIRDFSLAGVSLYWIQQILEDLDYLRNNVDRSAMGILAYIDDDKILQKIRQLRETKGRTLPEAKSMEERADRLEKRLQARLASKTDEEVEDGFTIPVAHARKRMEKAIRGTGFTEPPFDKPDYTVTCVSCGERHPLTREYWRVKTYKDDRRTGERLWYWETRCRYCDDRFPTTKYPDPSYRP